MRSKKSLIALAAAGALVALAGCQAGSDEGTTPSDGETTESATDGGAVEEQTVVLRLWDEQVATAYEQVIPDFEAANEGVTVDVQVIPWADYFTSLRNDIASGDAPDVFWVNSSNYVDYAEAGRLLNIDETFTEDEQSEWLDGVKEQFRVDGTLYGVPALSDSGIGVFYNKELLDEAGVTVEEVENLTWDPTGANDTLRDVAARLTRDAAGNTPNDAGFAPDTLTQFGYNAALDTQGIYLNYLGSNGAQFQDADGNIAYDTPEGVAAFEYIINLINEDHVAPSAADTNDNGDFSRDQFLQGNLALFQTGSYNLANVLEGADFEWGIAPLPEGPEGRVTVANGIVAAASADSDVPEAQRALLAFLGSEEGASILGSTGAALPAVTSAQDAWNTYWADQNVDVSPLVEVLQGTTSLAPFGANINEAATASNTILKEAFLGRVPVAEAVAQAQEAANAIINE